MIMTHLYLVGEKKLGADGKFEAEDTGGGDPRSCECWFCNRHTAPEADHP